jgi:hypothetical protein
MFVNEVHRQALPRFYLVISKSMMRRIAITFLILCAYQSGLAQQNTEKQMAGLKGGVRLVIHGWLEKDGKQMILTSTTYDRTGNETEVVGYATDPFTGKREPHHKEVSTFVGLIKTERSYIMAKPTNNRFPAIIGVVVNGKVQPPPPPPPPPIREPDGAVLWQKVYQLDAKGNWAGKIWYKGRAQKSSILSKYVYQRNEKGLIQEELVYEGDGTLSTRIAHKYNDDGIKIEYAEYQPDGTLRMKNTYTDFMLDEKGNWIKRTVKMFYARSDGTPVTTGQNEYREISYYPSAK